MRCGKDSFVKLLAAMSPGDLRIGISPTVYRAQNPQSPEKSQKVSREEFGAPPPRPQTPKSSKRSPKSREKVEIHYFLNLSNLFVRTFGGSGVGGSQTHLFFETFRLSGVLGSVDSQGAPDLAKICSPQIHHIFCLCRRNISLNFALRAFLHWACS